MALARVKTRVLTDDGWQDAWATAQLLSGLPQTRLLKPGRIASSLVERIRSAIKGAGLRYPISRVTLDVELPAGGALEEAHALPLAWAILVASDQRSAGSWGTRALWGRLALDGAVLAPAPQEIAALKGQAHLITGPQPHGAWLAQLHNLTLEAALEHPNETPDALVLPQGFVTELSQVLLAGGHSALALGEPGVGKTQWAEALLKHWPCKAPVRQRLAARRAKRQVTPSSWVAVGSQATHLKRCLHLNQGRVIGLNDLTLHGPALLKALPEQLDEHADTACVATTNPCLCGWSGSPRGRCRCTSSQLKSFQARLAAPLVDRFHCVVRFPYSQQPPHPVALAPIQHARQRQSERQGELNGLAPWRGLEDVPEVDDDAITALRQAAQALQLSGRRQLNTLRLARTVADLDGQIQVGVGHLHHALGFHAGV